MGIEPKPNNGTLRLPLQPVGFHTHDTSPEDPSDPPLPSPSPSTTQEEEIADAIISISPIEASSAADPNVRPPVVVGVDTPEDNGVARPVVDDTGGGGEKDTPDFLEWFKGKLNGLKGWFNGVFKGDKDEEEGTSGDSQDS